MAEILSEQYTIVFSTPIDPSTVSSTSNSSLLVTNHKNIGGGANIATRLVV